MEVHYLEIVASDVDGVCAAYEAAHGIKFESADPLLEVRERLRCRMRAALACAIPCGIRRSPSFDRTGSLTTSKQG
jgi:hypothetical protein